MVGPRVLRRSGVVAQVREVWLPLGAVLLAYAAAAAINRPLQGRIRPGATNLLGFQAPDIWNRSMIKFK